MRRQIQALDNGVVYRYDARDLRAPCFVDVSEKKIVAIFKDERNEFQSVGAFVAWAKSRFARDGYFVIVARPSGSVHYEALFNALDAAGYAVGVELVGENAELKFQSDSQ